MTRLIVRKKKPTDREKLDKPAARFVNRVVDRKCLFHEANKAIVITRDLPAIGNVQYHCACVPVIDSMRCNLGVK